MTGKRSKTKAKEPTVPPEAKRCSDCNRELGSLFECPAVGEVRKPWGLTQLADLELDGKGASFKMPEGEAVCTDCADRRLAIARMEKQAADFVQRFGELPPDVRGWVTEPTAEVSGKW